MKHLALAVRCLDDNDRAGALGALLDAWRRCRHPEIAALIELVSSDIDRALPPIEGKTRKAFQERWLDVAERGLAIDLGRLLEGLRVEPCTRMRVRVERLEVRPDDPRISAALGQMILDTPCTSHPNGPMWTRIFKILERTNDPRLLDLLQERLSCKQTGGGFYNLLYRRCRDLRDTLEQSPPPELESEAAELVDGIYARVHVLLAGPPPERTALDKQGQRSAEDTEAQLVRQVLDAPADDGPRRVLGDWLLERGDPRGELITLQFKKLGQGLTREETRQEKVLIVRHWRQWAGALEPAINSKEPVEFSRGFLSACTVQFHTEHQKETLVGHPLWATVERICAEERLLVDPCLRSLRAVEGMDPATWLGLAAREEPLSWEEVELCAAPSVVTGGLRPSLARVGPFVGLKHLRLVLATVDPRREPFEAYRGWQREGGVDSGITVTHAETFAWLLEGELGKRLEALSVIEPFETGQPMDFQSWVVLCAALERPLKIDIELRPAAGEKVRFTRDVDGLWELELTLGGHVLLRDRMERLFDHLEPEAVRLVRVHWKMRTRPSDEDRAMFRRLLAPFEQVVLDL